MKKRLYPLLALAAIVIAFDGCSGSSLTRIWFYTYASGSTPDSTDPLTPASFLELRSDGTYTLDFGKYDYGTWQRRQDQLFLTGQQHKTYVYAMTFNTPKELSLIVAKGRTGRFESQPLPSGNRDDDPFSAVNNSWRQAASHKESDEEIRRRLYNHCRFWERYFTWALDKKLDYLDVRSTPTAIKIYGNGFGLKPYDELPARWKAFFYDEEDCRKANEIITKIFNTKTIAWANTDSKYKMFIGAFQQMEQFLR